MTRLVKTRENISGLPNGFTEVEYLQSTGTQYIDIGLKGKNNLDFEYKCEFTNLDGTAQCVGGNWSGQSSSTVSMYFGLIRTNGNFAYHYDGTSSPVVVMSTTVQGTPYSIQGHLWEGEQYFVINGTKSSVGTIASEFTSSLNMYLFGINNNGLANPAYIKLHCFKLWNNNTLVRDFIPCLDNNSKPCMYDLVGKKPYYNLGTGADFSYGRQVIPVEYLESTGTQYINTGYTPSGSTETEITTMAKNQDTSRFMFGCRTNNSSNIYACLVHSSNRIGYRVGNSGYLYSSGYNELNVKHTYKIANGVFYRDGEVVNATCEGVATSPNSPLALLTVNTNNVLDTSQSFIGNLYSCIVKENNTLVRDYIPCIDENNVGFMFDRVTHTIYDNAGTGSFTYGSPIYTTKTRLIKDVDLPSGFRRVEYLESTGTQWIDTGFKIDDTCGYDVSWMALNANDTIILGTKGAGDSRWVLSGNNNPNVNISWNTPYGSVGLGLNKIQTAQMNYLNDRKRILNDVELTPITETLSSSASTYNVGIFAGYWGSSTVSLYSTCRIYYVKITKGLILVRDLIPVLDWDMTPCMYDKVSGQLFYNQGTGSFNYGNILPSKEKTRLIPSWLDDYTFVNYIESTGTQYINTGVTLTNNHSVEIDYQLTQASQSRAGLFGNLNMTGSNQGRFGSLLSPSNQQLEHGYGTGNDYWQQGSPDTNRHKLYQKKNEIYFDGTLIHTFTSATFTLNTTALLGNFVYTNYTPAKSKYYNSKWWNGDTLIRNFIPAIRKSDSAVGMLDIVNRVFYTNQGTGVFSYG